MSGGWAGRAAVPALLALLAATSALPRFGQRENERAALSDSDYYLDMAAVFAGDRPAFDADWSDPAYYGAHHYGRPLLPFLAGSLAGLGMDPLAAFSAIGVAAAWAVAVALHWFLARAAPALRHPWLPSALFLTGFPQVNWGYHVLTDTLGYATAFLAALGAAALLERGVRPRALALAGLFALQSLAFLARETAWIVPIVVAWLLVGRMRRGGPLGPGLAVLGVVLLAALPHQLYLQALGLRGVEIALAPAAWADPAYVADFLVKSTIAFHLLWVLALVGWRDADRPRVPPLLVGWSLGALGYMAAGYAHNTLGPGGIGYPLRLTWALFPAVLFLASWALQARLPARRTEAAAVALVVVNGLVALAGTALDTGRTGVTVPALLERTITLPR